MQIILQQRGLTGATVAGIVVTGEGANEDVPHIDWLKAHKIPVVACALDTYGAAIRINSMEVKINLKTPWKIRRAVELIEEHIDMDLLL